MLKDTRLLSDASVADSTPPAMLRLRRGVLHLNDLGVRAEVEFLVELGLAHGIEDDLLRRLDRWRLLTREMIEAAGADRFPPLLQAVPS